MTCVPWTNRFRLLDGHAGWEEQSYQGLTGLNDPAGVRLTGAPGAAADVLLRWLLPPWLARRSRPCDWFLIAGAALLHRSLCQPRWTDYRPQLAGSEQLQRPVALAASATRLAVADAGAHAVLVWELANGRLGTVIDIESPGPVAFTSWGELLIARSPESMPTGMAFRLRLARFSLSGEPRGPDIVVYGHGPVQRLVRDRAGRIWAATGKESGPFLLWRLDLAGEEVEKRDEANCLLATECCPPLCFDVEKDEGKDFAAHFPPTGLVADSDKGFCLEEPGDEGVPVVRCFRRDGTPARRQDVVVEPPREERKGVLKLWPLDSGIPRCRWHRVRFDADVPPGTLLTLRVASSEDAVAPTSDADWEEVTQSDTLLQEQPPGRFLHMEIKLEGDARTTPVLHRVRLDFPRTTSLDRLPAVYRDNPAAEDFSERFLSLFDATLGDLDGLIERTPALLDPAGVPPEVLPWLATLLGATFHPAWDEARRRRLLRVLPRLYRRRGTPRGLRLLLRLLFGMKVVLTERGPQRSWGAVGTGAQLRSVRLFGKSQARFRVGRSAIGAAPLRSYGNPDHDPFRDVAHRFTVLVPPAVALGPQELAQLDRLIAEQKPAHTLHALRVGGHGLVIGTQSAVGIDTRLGGIGPPLLGGQGVSGTTRLNRDSVLRGGRHAPAGACKVGSAAVGIHTVLE